MIENWFFVLAMVAVLMAPGPTNALLAGSAQQQGVLASIKLIPAQLFGYLYAISLWALLLHISLPIWPSLIHFLHFASTAYVIWLAFHLWKVVDMQRHSQMYPMIRPKQLFFATLKNPKALLFAAGIFPLQTWDSVQNFAGVMLVFALVLIPVALFWLLFGRALLEGQIKAVKTDQLYKGSAMLLMLSMLPVIVSFFML